MSYSYRLKRKRSGFYFLSSVFFIVAVASSALFTMIMWHWFIPVLFEGAVKKGLIVAAPSYWTFFFFMFLTTLMAITVEFLKPFVTAFFEI